MTVDVENPRKQRNNCAIISSDIELCRVLGPKVTIYEELRQITNSSQLGSLDMQCICKIFNVKQSFGPDWGRLTQILKSVNLKIKTLGF